MDIIPEVAIADMDMAIGHPMTMINGIILLLLLLPIHPLPFSQALPIHHHHLLPLLIVIVAAAAVAAERVVAGRKQLQASSCKL